MSMTYKPPKYLDYTHPDAFVDHKKLHPAYPNQVECPRCKGHGGWNLQLNAYKLPPNEEDTPENRYTFVHFRSSCGNCNGWGYVSKEEAEKCSGHDWKYLGNDKMGFNRYECIHCGTQRSFDTSD